MSSRHDWRVRVPLVLVIADAENDRDFYAESFERRGWRAVTTRDGPRGVAQAILLQPDVIMIDLDPREADGCSFVQQLKAHVSTKAIPVIACGPADDQVRRAAETAGVAAHVTKPCLPEYLVALARRHLN